MVSIAVYEGRQNVAMLRIGAHRPTRIVGNAEVCRMLDSTPEWIYERTGNTSAASIPPAMEEMSVSGRAKGGRPALPPGFGGGSSCAAQVVRLPPAPREPSL